MIFSFLKLFFVLYFLICSFIYNQSISHLDESISTMKRWMSFNWLFVLQLYVFNFRFQDKCAALVSNPFFTTAEGSSVTSPVIHWSCRGLLAMTTVFACMHAALMHKCLDLETRCEFALSAFIALDLGLVVSRRGVISDHSFWHMQKYNI